MHCVTELIHCTSHIDRHSSLTTSDGGGVCLEGRRGLVLGEGGVADILLVCLLLARQLITCGAAARQVRCVVRQ